eukprot:m.212756 g.212756  ORF g.212756 m.212756 type:complete len:708 (+) comp17169_c0_seq1:4874-6997(+)
MAVPSTTATSAPSARLLPATSLAVFEPAPIQATEPSFSLLMPEGIRCCVYSKEVDLLVVGLTTGELFCYYKPRLPFAKLVPDKIVKAHPRYSLRDLCFTKAGTQLVSSAIDHNIKLWNTHTWAMVAKLTHQTQNKLMDVCGDEVVVAGKHKCPRSVAPSATFLIQVFSLSKKNEVLTLDTSSPVTSAALQPPLGKLIAVGLGDGRIRIIERLNLAQRDVKKLITYAVLENQSVTVLRFINETHLLAAGSEGSVARVEARTGTILQRIQCHSRSIHNCYLDTSRDILATACQDHTARFFHMGTKQPLLVLDGHVRSVNDVCVTPHGIFTASTDHRLRSIPNILAQMPTERTVEAMVAVNLPVSLVQEALDKPDFESGSQVALSIAKHLHARQGKQEEAPVYRSLVKDTPASSSSRQSFRRDAITMPGAMSRQFAPYNLQRASTTGGVYSSMQMPLHVQSSMVQHALPPHLQQSILPQVQHPKPPHLQPSLSTMGSAIVTPTTQTQLLGYGTVSSSLQHPQSQPLNIPVAQPQLPEVTSSTPAFPLLPASMASPALILASLATGGLSDPVLSTSDLPTELPIPSVSQQPSQPASVNSSDDQAVVTEPSQTVPRRATVEAMSIEDVSTWLSHVHFQPFVDAFRTNMVDGGLLLMLTDDSLDELGVKSTLQKQRFYLSRQRLLNGTCKTLADGEPRPKQSKLGTGALGESE